jgi:hypothetical protein
MTATMDAMIFLAVITVAVGAAHSMSAGQGAEGDASEIADALFSAKVRISDATSVDDGLILPLTDIIAARMAAGDGAAAEYAEKVLDRLFERPGAYSLELEYGGSHIAAGTGAGRPASWCERDVAVEYGGSLRATLRIY